jgi:hypothetical protein
MHAARYYYASALLEDGVSIRAVAEYLGHNDPGFTLRVYAHLMPSSDARAREASTVPSARRWSPARVPWMCPQRAVGASPRWSARYGSDVVEPDRSGC